MLVLSVRLLGLVGAARALCSGGVEPAAGLVECPLSAYEAGGGAFACPLGGRERFVCGVDDQLGGLLDRIGSQRGDFEDDPA